MIHIWLVLCQMVPFTEVILLTAMEYHRKEQTVEEKEKAFLSVSSIVDEDENAITPNDEECKCRVTRCWIPELKTFGRFICNKCLLVLLRYMKPVFLSENPVLPSVVLASFIVYFAIAALFFLDF